MEYSESKNRIDYALYIMIVLFLCSLFGTFFVAVQNDYSKSPILPIAPMVYAFVVALVISYWRYLLKSITVLLVFGGFFVRMVLSPLTMLVAGYDVEIATSEWVNYIDYATILMVVEFVCVIVFFRKSTRLKEISRVCKENTVSPIHLNVMTKTILFMAVGFVIVCIISNPSYLLSIKSTLRFMFYSEQDNIDRNVMYNKMRENSSSLFTLYSTAIVLLLVLIPAAFLNMIYGNRLNTHSTKKKTGRIVLSLIVVLLSLGILTEDNSKSIIIAVAIFVTLIYIYPEGVRRLIPLFVFTGVAFAVFLLIVKAGFLMGRYRGPSSFARIINTYFSGIPNVAVGLTVSFPDKVDTFFGDILRSIPLMAHFFTHLPRSQDLFNFYYHGRVGYTNEIMPTICYGFSYIGPLAAIFPILIYCFAIKFEWMFYKAEKVFDKVVFSYLFIYLAMCPNMYMFTSALTMLCYSIVFYMIIRSNRS